MTTPLILLAIPSIFLGMLIGFPPEAGLLHQWLTPIFEPAIQASGRAEAEYAFFGVDGALMIATTALVAVAIVVAWRFFGVEIPAIGLRTQPKPEEVNEIAARPGFSFLYRATLNKWWFDDINHILFVVIGGRFAHAVWWFDREVVDGIVNGVGTVTTDAGARLRRVQTGHVQNYALGIAIGLIAMAAGYLVLATR